MKSILDIVKSCIKTGDFELHLGQRSSWICDLLDVRSDFEMLICELKPMLPLVGIEFGGVLLVVSQRDVSSGSSLISNGIIRKSGEYYPGYYSEYSDFKKIVSLVDDVVTTEISMREAELVLNSRGVSVGEYLCVLDRRKDVDKKLKIRSLVTLEQLGYE